MTTATPALSKERLDQVVDAVKETLSDEKIRGLSQRAVQAKVWHLQPTVAACLSDLRGEEERVRTEILKAVSKLVYKFHDQTIDATLARAGILSDDRLHAGSSLDQKDSFDILCLDAKERLYLTLKHYGWLADFFRLYPHHFYENSFQFVDRIPQKKLKARVRVIGLGIGGSMAVSGLAKVGVESVVGYEKRDADGTRSVSSRYQNASWRAYEIANRLLDQQAYEHLVKYRQRLNITYDDGTSKIVTSDRVQIILGSAIQASQESAKRYGANLFFGVNNPEDHYLKDEQEKVDIVALFSGAHTSELFPGLSHEMIIQSWPDLNSTCKMWLRIQESAKTGDFCTRGGEIGAQRWHYTIESARNTMEDIVRVKNNLTNQYERAMKKQQDGDDGSTTEKYEAQMAQLDKVMQAIEAKEEGGRFDYIFTNAPDNDHNRMKRDDVAADGSVVLDGGYTVEVKIAANSVVKGDTESGKSLLKKFSTDLIAMGGDACVPPNPLAAYGATLACEAADMVVQLAVSHGHCNSVLSDLKETDRPDKDEWISQVQQVKTLFSEYFNARSRAENYFQFVQTLICNLYSLPPMKNNE